MRTARKEVPERLPAISLWPVKGGEAMLRHLGVLGPKVVFGLDLGAHSANAATAQAFRWYGESVSNTTRAFEDLRAVFKFNSDTNRSFGQFWTMEIA